MEQSTINLPSVKTKTPTAGMTSAHRRQRGIVTNIVVQGMLLEIIDNVVGTSTLDKTELSGMVNLSMSKQLVHRS